MNNTNEENTMVEGTMSTSKVVAMPKISEHRNDFHFGRVGFEQLSCGSWTQLGNGFSFESVVFAYVSLGTYWISVHTILNETC